MAQDKEKKLEKLLENKIILEQKQKEANIKMKVKR